MKKHLQLFFPFIVSLFLFNSVVQAQTPFAPLGGPIIETREIDTTFNIQMNYIFGSLFKNLVPYGILRDYAMEFTKKLLPFLKLFCNIFLINFRISNPNP